MKSVCVFCGSSSGVEPVFAEAARGLAKELAESGTSLVYGGGGVGLMGELAREAVRLGVPVVGILPEPLIAFELGHPTGATLEIVPNMHARKARMAELSDAFLVLPGGLGTLEETFEITTWAQLGLHHKPVALIDVAGYFHPLIDFLNRSQRQGFISEASRALLPTYPTPEQALRAVLQLMDRRA